jgi:hypothetical protein
MSNSIKDGKPANLSHKTRLAVEATRKILLRAEDLANKQREAKARFKAARKDLKLAKKAAKEAARQAQRAQKELRNLLHKSAPKRKMQSPKEAVAAAPKSKPSKAAPKKKEPLA